METTRTRLSPICWATSATTVTVVAVELDVELEGGVDLGQGAAGELHVDHGAGDGDDAAVLQGRLRFSVTVIGVRCLLCSRRTQWPDADWSSRSRWSGKMWAGFSSDGRSSSLVALSP